MNLLKGLWQGFIFFIVIVITISALSLFGLLVGLGLEVLGIAYPYIYGNLIAIVLAGCLLFGLASNL